MRCSIAPALFHLRFEAAAGANRFDLPLAQLLARFG